MKGAARSMCQEGSHPRPRIKIQFGISEVPDFPSKQESYTHAIHRHMQRLQLKLLSTAARTGYNIRARMFSPSVFLCSDLISPPSLFFMSYSPLRLFHVLCHAVALPTSQKFLSSPEIQISSPHSLPPFQCRHVNQPPPTPPPQSASQNVPSSKQNQGAWHHWHGHDINRRFPDPLAAPLPSHLPSLSILLSLVGGMH